MHNLMHTLPYAIYLQQAMYFIKYESSFYHFIFANVHVWDKKMDEEMKKQIPFLYLDRGEMEK